MTASRVQPADKRLYRIAISEDDELMREGISSVVAREKEFKICGVAVDKKDTLALVEKKEPDVLLLNLFLAIATESICSKTSLCAFHKRASL